MTECKNIQEKRHLSATGQLSANTGRIAYQYSQPALGWIFLRHTEYSFEVAKKKLEAKQTNLKCSDVAIENIIIDCDGLNFLEETYNEESRLGGKNRCDVVLVNRLPVLIIKLI